MTRKKGTKQYFDRRICEISQSMREMGIGKRTRRKPEGEDQRWKYSYSDNLTLLARYKALGGNQSALGRELGISRQAVRKRLQRAGKKARESAGQTLGLLQYLFGDRK